MEENNNKTIIYFKYILAKENIIYIHYKINLIIFAEILIVSPPFKK